tara:strand:+ start:70 stop:1164 length:1095 start_codon:yes stop_codon:yes gene_type:complete
MDLGRAIYKILNDNIAVASMVGTRIAPNVMTQRAVFPFVVYDITNDIPTGQKDSTSLLDVSTLMVSAYADNYKDSNKLGNYIRTALDRVSGNYNGVEIQSIDFDSYDDIFDDTSGSDGIYRKALNFNVRIINDLNNIYSLDFDGVDDFVSINGISSVFSASAGSISLWAKIDTTTTTGNLFKTYVDANNSLAILYHSTDNELKINYKGGGSSITAVATDAIEGDGLWHHIVGTWDVSGDEIKLYLDSVIKQTTTSVPTFTGTPGASSIGNNANGGGNFSGRIDEVTLYNTELTGVDIKNIYNSGFPKAEGGRTGLIGWWKMGDGNDAGTTMAEYPTIPDMTLNSNDGTMTNMIEADIVADVPIG